MPTGQSLHVTSYKNERQICDFALHKFYISVTSLFSHQIIYCKDILSTRRLLWRFHQHFLKMHPMTSRSLPGQHITYVIYSKYNAFNNDKWKKRSLITWKIIWLLIEFSKIIDSREFYFKDLLSLSHRLRIIYNFCC